jgi:hypothetical protein
MCVGYFDMNLAAKYVTAGLSVVTYFQAGVGLFHLLLAPYDNTELETWFFNGTNKDFMYDYHKTFLQMLKTNLARNRPFFLRNV